MTADTPLHAFDAQQQREDRCPDPTPLALFLAQLIDWQQFVDADAAYRAAQGLPPEPCLLPTLMDLCDRMDARREGTREPR